MIKEKNNYRRNGFGKAMTENWNRVGNEEESTGEDEGKDAAEKDSNGYGDCDPGFENRLRVVPHQRCISTTQHVSSFSLLSSAKLLQQQIRQRERERKKD